MIDRVPEVGSLYIMRRSDGAVTVDEIMSTYTNDMGERICRVRGTVSSMPFSPFDLKVPASQYGEIGFLHYAGKVLNPENESRRTHG